MRLFFFQNLMILCYLLWVHVLLSFFFSSSLSFSPGKRRRWRKTRNKRAMCFMSRLSATCSLSLYFSQGKVRKRNTCPSFPSLEEKEKKSTTHSPSFSFSIFFLTSGKRWKKSGEVRRIRRLTENLIMMSLKTDSSSLEIFIKELPFHLSPSFSSGKKREGERWAQLLLHGHPVPEVNVGSGVSCVGIRQSLCLAVTSQH